MKTIALLCLLVAQEDKKQVVCTVKSLEAIAREVGADLFEYATLARPDEDPHFVSPTPDLWNRVRNASLFFEVGMQLEIWADEITNKSGNPKIFRGADGRVAVSPGIPKEEVPTGVVSRAQGDLHPEGNPHIWLDPVRAKRIAENMAKAMERLLPDAKEKIRERLKSFQDRIDEAMFGKELPAILGASTLERLALDGKLGSFLEKEYKGRKLIEYAGGWLKKAAPLCGQKVVEYHKVWVYFTKAFGMEIVGTIEEKPGIQPGPRYQQELTDRIRREGVKLVLVDNFYDASTPRKIATDGGAKVAVLPSQVGGEKGVDDYFALIDHVLDRMLEAAK